MAAKDVSAEFNPLEKAIQRNLVRWFSYQYPKYDRVFFHVPNGGSRHPVEAANLKGQGVKPGVFDLVLLVARKGYHGLVLELKRKGGRLSEHQKDFGFAATEQGYLAVCHDSLEDGITCLAEYLS